MRLWYRLGSRKANFDVLNMNPENVPVRANMVCVVPMDKVQRAIQHLNENIEKDQLYAFKIYDFFTFLILLHTTDLHHSSYTNTFSSGADVYRKSINEVRSRTSFTDLWQSLQDFGLLISHNVTLSSGDIPKNNPRKFQFLTKMTRNKKLPNFLSNFQYWFRNVLQHLTEVFRPYHPCKKSLEIDFQLPKKKSFLDFPLFQPFLGVYFYKVS